MAPRVIVAGSINMDVVVQAPRLPRIGETVAGSGVSFHPGGKGANQAVAAARLGAPTMLIGRVGADAFGRELVGFLDTAGIDLTCVRAVDGPSGTALITLVDADNAIVVVPGANGRLAPDDVALPLGAGDVLLSQLEIPLPAVEAFFAPAAAAGARAILNAAPAQPIPRSLLGLVDILVVNETELATLSGHALAAGDPPARFIAAARGLRARPEQAICVTLGARGVVALIGEETIEIAGHPVTAVDTTGAGDCFTGALAAELAAGRPLPDALVFANAAAALCVQRMGAGPSMPVRAEVAAIRLTV